MDIHERRDHRRYRLMDRGLVMVKPSLVFSLNVYDISKGGLAFTYAGWQDWTGETMHLDYMDKDLFLERLPVRIVSDIDNPDRKEDSSHLRRCGVQFINLKDSQQKMLGEYIHTIS